MHQDLTCVSPDLSQLQRTPNCVRLQDAPVRPATRCILSTTLIFCFINNAAIIAVKASVCTYALRHWLVYSTTTVYGDAGAAWAQLQRHLTAADGDGSVPLVAGCAGSHLKSDNLSEHMLSCNTHGALPDLADFWWDVCNRQLQATVSNRSPPWATGAHWKALRRAGQIVKFWVSVQCWSSWISLKVRGKQNQLSSNSGLRQHFHIPYKNMD